MKRGLEILLLCSLALLFLSRAQIAHAATILVDSTSYETLPTINGNCTLLEAIYAAYSDTAMDGCAAGAGSDVITLPEGTFVAGPGNWDYPFSDFAFPVEGGTMSIVGAGPDKTILQAAPGYFDRGIFIVRNNAQLTLNGLTLRDGRTSSNYGAAIRNDATIHIQNTWFIHNTSNEGGAIANGGTATIADSVFFDNLAATGLGGAIRNDGASLTISNTAMYSNTAYVGGALSNAYQRHVSLSNVAMYQNHALFGGGIINDGVMVIDQSQITANEVTGHTTGVGGGIINGRVMTVTHSTISGNRAVFYAGIYNAGTNGSATATLDISDSILANNNATEGGALGNGPSASATLTNVTVSGNTATAGVAGIVSNGVLDLTNVTIANNNSSFISGLSQLGGTTHVRNSIITNDSGAPNCGGAVTSDGHNLESGNTCSFNATGDLINTDPRLDALADNGGASLTHALFSGSPAIDAGDDSACPTTDQRAAPRPVDGNADSTVVCDIGAYEAESTAPAATPTQTGFPTSTPTPTLQYTYTPTFTFTPTNTRTFTPTPTATRTPISWYVAPDGNDGNSCTAVQATCATINGALGKSGMQTGDTIKVAVGTFTGTGSQVVLLNRNVILSGGWDSTFAAQNGYTTLDGQNTRRGVTIAAGTTTTIERLVIENGYATSAGGGIYNDSGTVTLNSSIVRNNISDLMGGGIDTIGSMTINDSSIISNTAGYPGHSGGGGGGGIEFYDGFLTLNRSLVSNNTLRGSFQGSGINVEGAFTANNSTVSNNHGGSHGEGIYGVVATMNFYDSTIAQNDHYGIYAIQSTVYLRNSLLGHNGTDCYNNVNGYNGTINSLGYNLVQNGGNCTWVSTDLVGLAPLLDSLAPNGGTTETLALLAGSPAIDAGDPSTCPATDQRGYARPQDGDGDGTARCDIGAYEVDAVPSVTSSPTAAPSDTPSLTPTPTETPTDLPTPTSTQTATPTHLPTATASATPEASVNLIGTVKINQLTGTYNVDMGTVPVDVVHVMDVSGSMSDNFDSMTKINAVKTAVNSFNNLLQSADGNQVGLVTYPSLSTGTKYNYNCQMSGSTTTYYTAATRSGLTSNFSSVNTIVNGLSTNGGTSLASGIHNGRQAVLDVAKHEPSRPAILIITSDGIANIRVNGKWTGFSGDFYNAPPCNSGAEQDALAEAQLAKADTDGNGKPDVIIYAIAIGDNFNPSMMQALASEPSSSHYYHASDAASLQTIYAQIAEDVQTYSCEVSQQETPAVGAVVTIRNTADGTTLQTTTDADGNFSFHVDPATWEFASASITVNGATYDTFTDGIGGPILAANPTIVVTSGSYTQDLSLKTNNFVCPDPPTRTPTLTPTETLTPTATESPTLTSTPSDTPSATPTLTSTPSDTPSATPTLTSTPSDTPSATPTYTATESDTPSATPSHTPTRTNTPTDLPPATLTFTSTSTRTFTLTPSRTNTPTPSRTFTPTASRTFTPTPSRTFTPTPSRTFTPTASRTNTPTPSRTFTLTPTRTRTFTPTTLRTNTPKPTPTRTRTNTPTVTRTSAPKPTATFTATRTRTRTNTPKATTTLTATRTRTRTNTPKATATLTATRTRTRTPTVTANGCDTTPAAPQLAAPANTAALAKTQVVLKWNGVECASTYQVQVRQDTKKGANWLSKNVSGVSLQVKNLVRGHRYYWRVQACTDTTCGPWSKWRNFQINP